MLEALSMPCLLMLAEQGRRVHSGGAELARECIADLNLEWVPGGHHFHMERSAPEIAQRIGQFFTE